MNYHGDTEFSLAPILIPDLAFGERSIFFKSCTIWEKLGLISGF